MAAALVVASLIAAGALAGHRAGSWASAAQVSPATRAAVVAPRNEQPPEVDGTLRDGGVALAFPGRWTGGSPLDFSSRWERCDTKRCNDTGRSGFVVRLGSEDVGKRMRAVVTASNDAATVSARSEQSALVKPKLQWMDPFPVVALRGFITRRRGIFVTRLAARATIGSTLRVACHGGSCPFANATFRFARGFVAVRRMHRRLGVGTSFSLRITQGENRIGKYTRFRVRPGRKPARVDRCLDPDDRSASRCEPPR